MDRVRRSLKSGAFGVEKCRSVGLFHLVRPNGLEPSTPTMSRWCSNQLSYGRTSDEMYSVNRVQKLGASEWTRTIDPHHVKVVL